jgi:S-adenosylmethionine/arginine decarboxylase-like enzyme
MEKVKHIKILGFGNPILLADVYYIEKLINSIINKVGMKPLGKTMVYDVPLEIEKLGREPFEDEGGVTAQLIGFSTLSTSHVALHSWPLRSEFHLDLYSCRYFIKEDVINFITDALQTTNIKVSDLTFACEWD